MKAAILAAALVTAFAGEAAAQTYRAGSLVIAAPWSRATPGGAKVAAGYVTITNNGTTPDRLVGTSAEVAGRGEVHEMVHDGTVVRMRPVEGIEIKPGAKLELKPGGYHLMFADLQRQLKQGERFKGTIAFEKAGTVQVEFAVRGVGAGAGDQHKH